ncbi:MAG: GNAT family N-acetyltransferase [Holosporales bacterium]|jgi:ribosomal protein S18 acetylase RimI-like enzyme|nr:GNAT family N-acetyltransferase [Holosporales bacterium]
MKIEIVENTPQEISEKMWQDLENYDKSNGIDTNYKRFSLIAKNDNEEVIGALEGYTVFAEVYVGELWVDAVYRGKGYGRKLLQELERQFQGKGFLNISLCTSEFQAPGFYKKCGFELEFVRKNHQYPKLTKYFFIKYFHNNEQAQGILKVPVKVI